jgi:hypothetical protein
VSPQYNTGHAMIMLVYPSWKKVPPEIWERQKHIKMFSRRNWTEERRTDRKLHINYITKSIIISPLHQILKTLYDEIEHHKLDVINA